MNAPDWIAAYAALGFFDHLTRDGQVERMAKLYGDHLVTVAVDGATITASIGLDVGVIRHHSLASDPTRAWDLLREDIQRRAREMSALAEAMRPPVTRSPAPPENRQ